MPKPQSNREFLNRNPLSSTTPWPTIVIDDYTRSVSVTCYNHNVANDDTIGCVYIWNIVS